MRSLSLALAGASMLAACSFNATGITATTIVTTEGTTGAATTTASTDDVPTTSASVGDVCAPGTPAPCECPFGEGQHTCNPDGEGYGPCDCPDDPTTTAALPDTTTTATTSVEPDTTTSTTGTTTGTPDTTTGDDTTSTSSTSGDDTTSTSSTSGDDTTTSTDESTTDGECVQVDVGLNGTALQAPAKAEILCGQGKPGGMFSGTLDGDQDIDWWKYHGAYNSVNCSNTNPTHVYTLTADEPIRLCVFAACDVALSATVTCGPGSSAASDLQVPTGSGCCGMGNFQFEFNCDLTDNESSTAYLRLDGAASDTCVDYTVTYDYVDK